MVLTKKRSLFLRTQFCELISGGIAPDLRASSVVLSSEAFASVVRDGARRSLGMPSYESLSDAQLEALRHYIREQAELALPSNHTAPESTAVGD